jgi:hypothetical protein
LKKRISNEVISEASLSRGLYEFYVEDAERSEVGNYVVIEADSAAPENSEEVLRLGVYEDGRFEEKYRYTFTAMPGKNKYIFRVSSDYNWYVSGVNAASAEEKENAEGSTFSIISMAVLAGD